MKKILAVALTAGAAILLGAVIGGLSGGFLWLIDLIQKALWENSLAQVWYAPLVICTLGGLLVGLCQRYLGNHPKSINEAVQELAQSGRLAYRHLPQGLVTVGVSLSAGASLGPEAAIMDLLGGLSTWAADVLRRVRVSLHLPAAEGAVGLRRWLDRWPNILAIGLGIFGFGALARGLYSDGFLRMQESFAWSDLPWSVLLGLLGAALGALYQWIFTSGQRLVSQRLPDRPVMRALVAGALFGLCASWLPMMTFSGQHDLQLAYDQAAQFGALTLLAVGLARLIFTAVLLFSGWKGGQFLPLMFASTAFGLGLAQLLPGISAPAGILAVMGGLLAVILPKPWFALALMLLMFPLHYALIPIAAVAAAVLAKGLAVKITHRAAAAAPGLIS